MLRWLTALPLTLALAALSTLATSCGSSRPAQVRFIHAIQDGAAMDIDVNGTLKFADLSFLGVLPNQPGYTSVPSGSDTIKGLAAGTPTAAFSDTTTLSAGGQYTLIATGFSQTGTNGSNVVLLSISDSNAPPPSGDIEFRVIHASPTGSDGSGGAVDVYIEPNPNSGLGLPITISGLAYTQASKYISLTYISNGLGYQVYVTASGSTTPIFSETINPAAAGAIRTLVLTDVQNGTSMRPAFLELSDLN